MIKSKRYIVFMLVVAMVLPLIACSKDEEEISFMDIEIDQVIDRFEDENLKFSFQEEGMEDGQTKFIGKNAEGMGSATLTLIGDKEMNKLSSIKMVSKISRDDEMENTYNALYLLGLINSVVEFNEAKEWLLEGMKIFAQDQKFVHNKIIDRTKLRMYVSGEDETINLEVLEI